MAAIVVAMGGTSAATGLAYAAHLENNDAFCASCHTQPEIQYYQRSVAQPVDLASAHAVKSVECIQCHSGRGALGRVSAIATVAIPDLIAYKSGRYHRSAVVTLPISDDHCLKCHAGIGDRQDFNNHFHVYLSIWRARTPRGAATCVDCYQPHVTGGLVDRVKPAASHVPSGTVDKAGLELSGPADGGIFALQFGWAYQASEGE